jgi:hypothetical protein
MPTLPWRATCTLGLLALSTAAFAAPEDLIRDERPGADWDDRVERITLAMYDLDGSGVIDTQAEISGISCPFFAAIDDGVRRDWSGSGVRVIYGFDEPYGWVGSAIGFAQELRAYAADAMTRCGVTANMQQAPAQVHSPTHAGPNTGGRGSPATAIGKLDGGASETWAEDVKALVLGAYDLDQSGEVDTTEELALFSCETWRAIDTGVRQGWDGSSVRVIYGFDEGFIWVGYALGLAEHLRLPATAAMDGCNISADSRAVPPVTGDAVDLTAQRIDALFGASNWDDAVAAVLVEAYDLDRNGMIQTGRELKKIPCDVWFAMDRHVLASNDGSAGLRSMYGFATSFIWGGAKLAIHEKLRARADKAMARCGLI